MAELFIYGSGSTGCELVDSVRRIHRCGPRWDAVHFVDDIRVEREHYGISVWRFDEMLAAPVAYECVIALGEPADRRRICERLATHGVSLATVVDPSATVSDSAEIGPGCIIGVGSFVSCNTRLGANVMLEINTIVGHDIAVGDHSVISSCSVIGGHTVIGAESFVGLNATIKDRLSIGSQCIIGMGSSVFNSIEDGMTALGNPARVVQRNQERQVFRN